MTACPCGSEKAYTACCGPFLDGTARPATAEQMMRARYTAHTRADIDFIAATIHPESAEDFDADSARRWAEESEWVGLEISGTSGGGPDDEMGTVAFTARFRDKRGELQTHRELSFFKKVDGEWRFRDAQPPELEQVRREAPKVGRNDPCTCGSGKKYKKCCGKAA